MRISYAARWSARRSKDSGCPSLRSEKEREGSSTQPPPRTPRPKTQKGPGIAARPRVAGLLPWIRTDRSARFRRLLHSRRQGHASFGSVVEAGRYPLTPKGSCGCQPRRPASSLRPGPEVGSLAGRFLRSIPPGPSASLARHIRLADLPAVRSFVPGAERLRTHFREPGFVPFPSLPSRFEPHFRAAFGIRFPLRLRAAFHSCFARRLRAALHFRSSRAPLFPETLAAPGRHFGFATCRSFRIPEPFPNAVSRRHLHRFWPM